MSNPNPDFWLTTATGESNQITYYQERTAKLQKSLRRSRWLDVLLGAGVLTNAYFALKGFTWDLNLVMAPIHVGIMAGAGFGLGWLQPRTRRSMRESIENYKKPIEEAAHRAVTAMQKYELTSWQKEFDALLPKPDNRTAEQILYGTAASMGLHAEKEIAFRMAVDQARREARMMQAEARATLEEQTRAAQAEKDRREKLERDLEAARIRDEERERRRQSKKVHDFTDWQGDQDPRRVWADDICLACDEPFGTANYHVHFDEMGRMVRTTPVRLGPGQTPATNYKLLEEEMAELAEQSRNVPELVEARRRNKEMLDNLIAQGVDLNAVADSLQKALTSVRDSNARKEEVLEVLTVLENQSDRETAAKVFTELNAPKQQQMPIRCTECGQYVAKGGWSKHNHGREKGEFQVTA
ncbi:hypothetical protein HOT31_gp114 [Microbacterium phage Hendrix]|uniref:Uncharacterized protein n=1 Tax=Microbacterium phage Hendrix TaxID=2182341 RepID=A0A2U8UUA0_9CAUD|nr:hypothetical protein HOT31_gp114 [Microbacterium phage Hendrix]AWN07785.1 hypothetical protein PBI_HENDRIX_114 [Microbacterium phage Hendrix]